MRTRTVLGTAVMTIALVAGIGLTGSSAQAKTTTTVTGTAKVSVLTSAITDMSLAGIQVGVEPPATTQVNDGNNFEFSLPVSQLPKAGVLPLEGGISIGAIANRLWLTAPRLEYSASSAGAPARMTLEVQYMGPDAPAGLTDGTRITLFEIPRLVVKTTKGRVTSLGKAWTRGDTHRLTGDLHFVNNAALLASINDYIGSSYLTPQTPFATLNTVIKAKVTCATRAACK